MDIFFLEEGGYMKWGKDDIAYLILERISGIGLSLEKLISALVLRKFILTEVYPDVSKVPKYAASKSYQSMNDERITSYVPHFNFISTSLHSAHTQVHHLQITIKQMKSQHFQYFSPLSPNFSLYRQPIILHSQPKSELFSHPGNRSKR